MHLRAARPHDAGVIAAILDREISDGYAHFGTDPPRASDLAQEIAAAGPHPWRVVEVDDGVVGFGRATPWKARGGYAWTVEIGVYVAPSHQGRGLGRLLVGDLLRQLEARGLRTVLAGIALPNPASVALFEGLGFVHAGTLPAVGYKGGAWRDVGYWSRHLGAGPPTPIAQRPEPDPS